MRKVIFSVSLVFVASNFLAQQINLETQVKGKTPIVHGGTGADNAAQARANLGVTTNITVYSTDYIWTQTPGGSLTAGFQALVTLTPCPLGVSGNITTVPYRIYDGVGTPEVVYGDGGGSGNPGDSSCIIKITPLLSNHTGAWKIGTATAGTREAIYHAYYLGAVVGSLPNNGWGSVEVVVPPGRHVIYAPTQYYVAGNQQVRIRGLGQGVTIIVRNYNDPVFEPKFLSGDVFAMGGVGMSPGAKYILEDLTIESAQDINVTSGAHLAVYGNSIVAEVRNVTMTNGYDGIVVYSSSLIVENVSYNQEFQHINNGHTAHYGMDIRKEGAAGGPPSGVRVYHSSFTAGGMSSTPAWPANTMLAGIHIGASAGIEIADTTTSGMTGIHIQNDGVNAIQDVWVHDVMIDDMGAYGVYMEGTNAYNSSILLSKLHIRAQGSSGAPANTRRDGIVGDITGGHIRVEHNEISGFDTGHGIVFHGTPVATVEGLQVVGNHIVNCKYGMQIPGAGYNDVILSNNVVGIQAAFGGAMLWSLDLPSGGNRMTIKGNTFYGSYAPVVGLATGPFTNFVMEGNAGVDSIIPTVASAASIYTGPFDSAFYPKAKITGTTLIATILPVWTGRTWSATFTDVTPMGFITGGNIAKSVTVAQHDTVDLYYDGTLWRPVQAVSSVLPTIPWTGVTNRPFDSITDYQFTRTNGAGVNGDLSSAGPNKTITFTSGCPFGVIAGLTNYYLYFSGGTGTAEAAHVVAGGTCTSGLVGGTMIVDTIYDHTGAWTVTSATAGAQELTNYYHNTLGQTDVHFRVPTGTHTLRGPWTIRDGKSIRLEGDMENSSVLSLSTVTGAVNLLQFVGSTYSKIEHVVFYGSAGKTHIGVYANSSPASNGGHVDIENCSFGYFDKGIKNDTAGNLFTVHKNRFSGNATSDVEFGNNVSSDEGGVEISQNIFGSASTNGILVHGPGNINIQRNSFNGPVNALVFDFQMATVNTNGTAVSRVSGYPFLTTWTGSVLINGVTYTISSVPTSDSMVLTGSAGVQTGVAFNYYISGQVSITKNTFDGHPDTGLKAIVISGKTPWGDIRIHDNMFSFFVDVADTYHIDASNLSLSAISITGNNFSHGAGHTFNHYGVKLNSCFGCVITGNTFTNLGKNVHVDLTNVLNEPGPLNVSVNTFRGWLANNTGVYLKNVVNTGVVSNNSFQAIDFGVIVDGANTRGIKVSGNVMQGVSGTSSILVDVLDGDYTSVTNNDCSESNPCKYVVRVNAAAAGTKVFGNSGIGSTTNYLFGAPTLFDGVQLYQLAGVANGVGGCATANGCWSVNGGTPVAQTAGLTQDVVLFALPAKGFVESMRIKTNVLCTGATTANTGLGTTGSNVYYRAQTYDIKAAVSDTNKTEVMAATGSDTVAGTNVVASLITTVDNVDQIVDTCKVDYWIGWRVLP